MAAAVAGGLYAYGRLVEPGRVEVTQVPLVLPRLDPAFDGYRIVQISDVHMDSFMTLRRLCALVEIINAQQPDLVAMTGDFVTSNLAYDADELMIAFSGLRARDAAVAILGNHDYHSGVEGVRAVIRRSGMIELSNEVYTLRRGAARLHIAGLDDIWAQAARLDLVLDALPPDGAAVLLVHEPDVADLAAATGRFDVQLSGHTHGGQIVFPLIGPLYLPAHGHRYERGLYYLANGMRLYVNRGVGMIALPIRFGSRPEITVITLHSSGAAG
ncbi:MAG: metallophosphoesterase [Chloroflexi bacterium]|nr:metallophosphoesterase [Chloroflexota bacterium]